MSAKSGGPTLHARQRSRELLARQARQEHRRRLLLRVGVPVLAVLLIVGTMVGIKLAAGPGDGSQPAVGSSTGTTTNAAADDVVRALSTIPASTFDTIGAGSGSQVLTKIDGEPLTANGVARVVYVGAEYCPYCAAQRWAVSTALSRFGTFDGVSLTSSSGTDSYPNTATMSFHGSTFTSDVLSFSGYETTSNVQQSDGSYTPLDTVPSADQALVSQYDAKGSIPFLDLGNRYTIVGASFDPTLLSGLTQDEIAAAIADPTTDISKAVVPAANAITAGICQLTGSQPAAVCQSPGVTAATANLPA